jgi:hypothetical protein
VAACATWTTSQELTAVLLVGRPSLGVLGVGIATRGELGDTITVGRITVGRRAGGRGCYHSVTTELGDTVTVGRSGGAA